MMSVDLEELGHSHAYYYQTDSEDLGSVAYISKGELVANKDAVFATSDRLIQAALLALKNNASNYQLLASMAYKYAKREVAHLDPKAHQIDQSMALLFRNKVSAETIKAERERNSDWYKIVLANHIHYKSLSSNAPFIQDQVSLPIGDSLVLMDALKKEELEGEIQWKHDDKTLFTTDDSFKLKDSYFAGVSGILPGSASSPLPGNELKPFLKVASSGLHKVWVLTSMKEKGGVCLGGDHVYMALEDPEGNVSFFGQYSKDRAAPWYNFLQKYDVAVESPDRYAGLPFLSYFQTKRELTISKEQFETLKSSVVDDLQNGNIDRKGSALTDNCAGYVAAKLQKIGVDIKAKMSLGSVIVDKLLSFLPAVIRKPVIAGINALPSTLKKAIYYLPIPGLPILLTGVVFKIAGMFSEKARAVKFSLSDLIFKPWDVNCNHPFGVYQWQMEDEKRKDAEERVSLSSRESTLVTP